MFVSRIVLASVPALMVGGALLSGFDMEYAGSASLPQAQALSTVAATVVRYANSLTPPGEAPVQRGLDTAVAVFAVDSSTSEFTSLERGSGDAPRVTLILENRGVSCSVEIGVGRGDGFEVVRPVSCR